MFLTSPKGFCFGVLANRFLANRFFSAKAAVGGVGGGVAGSNRFILIVVRFLLIEFLTPSLAQLAKRPKLNGFDSYSLRIRALNSSSFRELSALLRIDAASLDSRFILSPSVSRYTGDFAFI